MFAMLPMGGGGQLRASFRNHMRQASGSSGLGNLVKNGNHLARKISPNKGELIKSIKSSERLIKDSALAKVRNNSAPVERLTRITKEGHKILPKLKRGGGTPIDTSGWKSLKRPEIPARPPKQAFSKSSLDLRGKLSGKTPRKMTPDDYWRLTDTPRGLGSKSINTSSTGSLVKSYR